MSGHTMTLLVSSSETGGVQKVVLPRKDNSVTHLLVTIRTGENGEFDTEVTEGVDTGGAND